MDLLSLIFTGIGLAMDASAVSIAKGMSLPNENSEEIEKPVELVKKKELIKVR